MITIYLPLSISAIDEAYLRANGPTTLHMSIPTWEQFRKLFPRSQYSKPRFRFNSAEMAINSDAPDATVTFISDEWTVRLDWRGL